MALRVFPKLIYGSNHSYGNPMTGTGTEDSVKKITRNDLFKFHQNWIKPNNATIVVVGDTTMKEILSKLEHLLLGWKMGEIPKKDISFVTHQPQSKIYIMDRPDSISSIIFGGHIAPPTNNPDEIAIEALNEILGGSFTSRVNMNLREDKHWSYGAFTFFSNARGQRPFVAYSTVQEDKTKESLLEILKEIQDIRGNKPITEAELEKAKNRLTRELPGSWETIGSVGATIGTLIQYGFPDDYYITYPNKVMALKVDYLMEVAKRIIEPEKMVWVVVGDRFKIEKPLRELSFGEIGFLDGDGNVLG
jgi:zinc protease